MAARSSEVRELCVNKKTFYRSLEELKSKQKTSASLITLYIDDEFYNRAKDYLKSKVEDGVEEAMETEVHKPAVQPLSIWEKTTITRKKWKYLNDSIAIDGRKVVPKRKLYDILSLAHHRVAHRGRQITLKSMQDNFSEVNQKVVNIYTNMCKSSC